ncbi:autotransporter [Paraburkholderia sp. BCC1876]|uniref:autotransporter n=1 Tax=Paraburkholderia sp. BCC1876 TaxID=2676303 RepID=UPI0015900269|nr:autotransporter [Paraburkholderia sp. BCC1876]
MSDIHAVPPRVPRTPETEAAEATAAPVHRPGEAPAATPAGAPQARPLVDDTLLGRLGNTLSRTGARLRASKFDVSTALSQASRHGKPFAPADFTANGERYPAKPVAGSSAAATPLAKSERQSRQALGKTARASGGSGGSGASAAASSGALASSSSAASTPSIAAAAHAATPAAAHEQPASTIPLDAMASEAALREYVGHQLPAPANDLLAQATLSHRLSALGGPDDALPASRGALVAQALHGATIGDSRSANNVLDALDHLDFAQMHTARSSTPAEAGAWQVARTLARTDAGFEALNQLRHGGQPAPGTASTQLAQRMMLQAADALDPPLHGAGPAQDPAPAAVAARAAPAAGTPVSDAPLAWQAYDAAATLTTQGRGALNADQKGAFFAWRQNFREDGRGSDLSQARERLNKFSAKTIDRVGENRWKSFFPRLVGKRSSPLSALRFGTQGVPRKTVGAEQAKLEDGMRQALAPLCERPEMRAAAALSHARPEQSIAELAALHVWLEAGGFPNGRLDAGQLHQVTERAQQLCAELQPRDVGSPATLDRLRAETTRWANTDPHTLGRSKPFKSIAKQPFNLERLASWGKVAKVPADSPFWTQVSSLKDRARPPTPTADAESAGAVRQTLKDVAHDLQSSSRLRLTDGNRIGVSTRGLSANLSKVLHAGAVPIAPRLDLRASKTREAVVELSRGTHGVEMFVGTAKTQVRHAGVGLLVGYDVDVGLTQMRAGLTTQAVLHSQELSEPSGVSLRVARRVNQNGTGYDDGAMREKLEGVIDHVFDETTQTHGANSGGARGTWNRLAEHYFDDPDVSVSWTDTVARTVKRGASADVGVSVSVPKVGSPFRAGAALGIGYEKTAKQTLDSNEQSGRVQVEQHRVGAGSRLIGRLSGTLSATQSVGAHDSSVGVGLVSLDAPSASMTFADDSHLAKVQLVRENGALMHRACLFDTEYSSAETYTRAVDASRDQWVDLFAEQALAEQDAERQDARLNGRPAPQQPPARAVAEERLDRHLGDVKANRRPNQTYFHRYRLKRGAAKQLDLLAAMSKQLPPAETAAGHPQIDAKVDGILNDPASWMPIELKVKERTTSTRSPGFNFALQLNTQTSATGDRELFAESIPFALVDRLDG